MRECSLSRRVACFERAYPDASTYVCQLLCPFPSTPRLQPGPVQEYDLPRVVRRADPALGTLRESFAIRCEVSAAVARYLHLCAFFCVAGLTKVRFPSRHRYPSGWTTQTCTTSSPFSTVASTLHGLGTTMTSLRRSRTPVPTGLATSGATLICKPVSPFCLHPVGP